jgi:preprotein translocase subunit SecD
MVDRSDLRRNWRVVLLTVMIVLSGVVLFVPPDYIGVEENQVSGPTNLQYGLELDGGSRIRAPVKGMYVSNALADGVAPADVEDSLTNIESVDENDILVRPGDRQGTITAELFLSDDVENVSKAEFARALQDAGVDVTEDDVRDGVSDETRGEIVDTVDDKISRSGFAGTSVSQASSSGNNFVVVEAPDKDPEEIWKLIERRGQVRIVARYPTDDGYQNETVLNAQELEDSRIGVASRDERRGSTYVPITLDDEETAREFSDSMQENGFTTRGISNCRWQVDKQDSGYCLLTVVDGEVVYAASMAEGLAQNINSGTFVEDPTFRMLTTNISDARDLQVNLRAGSLRAPLDRANSQVFTIQPALAEGFKLNSLITGIIAVLAVSLVVYLRYSNVEVAVPMIVTALSEVLILLGFAAIVKLQLDLSHLAGFIAVIGTGVDDLIIIADEVMSEGEVNSSRVFQNRFRKAFWVIGAAAATTIVAMSPLAVLSLGDLRGFAIITILGVLVGVLVTRPAYGDILKRLLTDR